jgi:hypothetical protein
MFNATVADEASAQMLISHLKSLENQIEVIQHDLQNDCPSSHITESLLALHNTAYTTILETVHVVALQCLRSDIIPPESIVEEMFRVMAKLLK